MPISHVVSAVPGTCSLTGTTWSATGGTAVQCLATAGDGKYLSAGFPFVPPNVPSFTATNLGFALPADAYDISIEVQFNAKHTGAAVALSPKLTKDGTIPSDTGAAIALTTSYAQYGTTFYGYTLAEVNAATFGLIAEVSASSVATAFVEQAVVYVTYWTPGVIDPPPDPTPGVRDLSASFIRIPNEGIH